MKRILAIKLKASSQKRADSLPPNILRTSAKAVAEREINTQREEFRELGILADWSAEGTYRTLGELISLVVEQLADPIFR